MIGKLLKVGVMLWGYVLFTNFVRKRQGPLLASSPSFVDTRPAPD